MSKQHNAMVSGEGACHNIACHESGSVRGSSKVGIIGSRCYESMDRISKEARSENMRRIASKDTGPELTVRRLVHSLGYRYRLHRHDLPGRPDMVFTSRRKVVFVHGCFWHQHEECGGARTPKSNKNYWTKKLRGNARRDVNNRLKLSAMGWDSLVIWECSVGQTAALRRQIKRFLGNPR